MKPEGKHPDKALSALKVKHLGPGRHADGNGLYLVVDNSGAKRWLLRIVVQGKRRDIGLGGFTTVSLSEARERALELRKVARSGGDPVADKRALAKVIPTFSSAAELVHAEHKLTWKNQKHAQQWINTLSQYAFPIIGNMTVDKIDTPDVLKVLAPIWLTKPETARRVRQRLSGVFDWAKAAGFRTGDNPVEGVSRGLPRQVQGEKHFDAMPYTLVAGFMRSLAESESSQSAKLSFQFLILTASRTSEVLHARWDEINFDERLWIIPETRMKAGKIHRVPLSPQCMKIIDEARKSANGSVFLFPSRSIEKHLSNMVFLTTLKRMKLTCTAHGFRSSFRDWASEETSFPREVVEMAPAHTIEHKVEAAYRRGDLLEKRRDLMTAWANFISEV